MYMYVYFFIPTPLFPPAKGSAKTCQAQKPRAVDINQGSQEPHVVLKKNTDAGPQPSLIELEFLIVEIQDVD